MSSKTSALIARLSAKIHDCLGPLVPAGKFALVDFPDIRNVGDSAIWLGETAYFERQFAGRRPAYVSTLSNFDAAQCARTVEGGPIFIHGGGNFGDIWLGHQTFRERLLDEFRDRPIIQLPQSIHYNDPERIAQTARLIERHGNFTLMVRDYESLAFAEKHFQCLTVLCPDMAFAIGETSPVSAPSVPVLAMLRKDREQVSEARDTSPWPAMPVEDWITESALEINLAKLRGGLSVATSFDPAKVRRELLEAAARTRFARGVRQLSRAQVIVTDRLHVHIISLLLGKPHAVLDNSYGKIARYMAAFSGDNDLSYRASSLSDAVEWAENRAQSTNEDRAR